MDSFIYLFAGNLIVKVPRKYVDNDNNNTDIIDIIEKEFKKYVKNCRKRLNESWSETVIIDIED